MGLQFSGRVLGLPGMRKTLGSMLYLLLLQEKHPVKGLGMQLSGRAAAKHVHPSSESQDQNPPGLLV